jgi:hypothetical protein
MHVKQIIAGNIREYNSAMVFASMGAQIKSPLGNIHLV